ncbi:odorant receptor 47a-like [Drosophila innubila]|uniref:odorant receptor 47a-like n=1 Tax=Drosophila innubila TaxID=198719 RepID=UPI00148BF073|nr:odorant receptor 47a-like [Drosophila innubila]
MHTLTEDFLKVQRIYFRILGFDIVKGNNGWLHPCKTLWVLISLAAVQPMIVAFSLKNVENVDRLTDGLGSVLVNLLSLLKFGLIIWLHKDFRQLVDKFQNMLSREYESEVSAKIISQENRREQRVSGFYKNSFVLTGALSCLMPIVSIVLFYSQTGEWQLQLTFPCIYPWDNGKMYNSLFSYVLLVSATTGAVLPTICVDTFFTALTHNLVALFKTAQYKMQLFGVVRLAEILLLYRSSLDMSNALNRYFRLIICMQLVVASLLLCVLSYTLSENYAQPQMPFYAVFTLTVLLQLYIYCYCGEYLKTESREFARAIYDSPWYEATAIIPEIGRSLQISMIRAQRGSHIDGYFFEANMEVFLSIVMTAGSYFTLLRSIS